MSNKFAVCPERQYHLHPHMDDFKNLVDELEDRFPDYAYRNDICTCYMEKYLELQRLRSKRYLYFVTYTIKDPREFDLAKQYIDDRVNLDYIVRTINVVEHKETNPHIHSLVASKIPLEKSKQFKHYINRFGFIDFRPVDPKTVQQVVDYMTKEGTIYTPHKPQMKREKEEAIKDLIK